MEGNGTTAPQEIADARRCKVPGCTEERRDLANWFCGLHFSLWMGSGEFKRSAAGGDRQRALLDFILRVSAEKRSAEAIDAAVWFPGCTRYEQPLAVKTCRHHTDCNAADDYAKSRRQQQPPHCAGQLGDADTFCACGAGHG